MTTNAHCTCSCMFSHFSSFFYLFFQFIVFFHTKLSLEPSVSFFLFFCSPSFSLPHIPPFYSFDINNLMKFIYPFLDHQCLAYRIQNGHQGAPNWPTGSANGSTQGFSALQLTFATYVFFIPALLL